LRHRTSSPPSLSVRSVSYSPGTDFEIDRPPERRHRKLPTPDLTRPFPFHPRVKGGYLSTSCIRAQLPSFQNAGTPVPPHHVVVMLSTEPQELRGLVVCSNIVRRLATPDSTYRPIPYPASSTTFNTNGLPAHPPPHQRRMCKLDEFTKSRRTRGTTGFGISRDAGGRLVLSIPSLPVSIRVLALTTFTTPRGRLAQAVTFVSPLAI